MKDVDKRAFDYASRISKVIYDDEAYEIEPLFYLTCHCNLHCTGCYMKSGPNVSRDVLPSGDIRFYLSEFEKHPLFTNNVVFSGGEVFTTPISYLEYNAHQVLDRGYGLQLKTNGAWVQNPCVRDAVLAMMRRLQPARGLVAGHQQIREFLDSKPKILLRMLGRDIVRMWMYAKLPTVSMLSVAVSVDDLLHPSQSAQWFADIAKLFSSDKRLRDKVELKTFTLSESKAFFEQNVLNAENLKVSDFQQFGNRAAMKYNINGRGVESYFGDYVDVDNVSCIAKLSNIVMPPLGDANGRLVYCFYPDRTVGFDCFYLSSVGRVSYVDNKTGQCKSLQRIRQEIYEKLVSDYYHEISK